MFQWFRTKREDAFAKIPPEVHCRIFWKLDGKSLQAARLVSKRWNLVVSEAVDLRFTSELTDATLKAVANSKQIISGIKIHDFQGANGNVVSGTRGVGPVFGCAEAIHLIGRKINTVELKKMLGYGVGSVTELSFKNCSWSIMKSTLDPRKPFTFLKCLRLSTTSTLWCLCPSKGDSRFLKRLDTPQAIQQLPHLQDFTMTYEADKNNVYNKVSQKSYVKRHLTAYKFLLRFVQTLKNVSIQRNGDKFAFGSVRQNFEGPQLTQLQEIGTRLGTLQLESLHIDIYFDSFRNSPWILERTLIQEQRGLKKLSIGMVNECALTNSPASLIRHLIPRNGQQLRSIEISTRHYNLRDGNRAVNLSILTDFTSLETLALRLNLNHDEPYFHRQSYFTQMFSNIEQLPNSITYLHLKQNRLPTTTAVLHLISKSGVRWIIENLKGLKSLQIQLITCEQAGYGVYQRERFYRVINIDPPTFRDLLSLRNLEEMSVDIMGLNFESEKHSRDQEIFVELQSVTNDDKQVYGGICEQHSRTQFVVINNDPRFNVRYLQISKN